MAVLDAFRYMQVVSRRRRWRVGLSYGMTREVGVGTRYKKAGVKPGRV